MDRCRIGAVELPLKAKDLPMHEPVVVEFTPDKPEEIDFTCSMKMVGGKIEVN
ncbi:MAG: hypothetical protein IPM66_11395 [Acidobacteriota bacterium]|nr:MAG: hypothetical protein IPM66_11395 [Acidobacteriota bacterium]